MENTRPYITHLQCYKCATVDDVINTTTYILVIPDAVTSTNRRLHNRLLLRLMWVLLGGFIYISDYLYTVYMDMFIFLPSVSSFTPTHVSAICLTLSFYIGYGTVVGLFALHEHKKKENEKFIREGATFDDVVKAQWNEK